MFRKIFHLIIIFIIVFAGTVGAWSSSSDYGYVRKSTHAKMAANGDIILYYDGHTELYHYLKTYISGKQLCAWIREGADIEDFSWDTIVSFWQNHFHDPYTMKGYNNHTSAGVMAIDRFGIAELRWNDNSWLSPKHAMIYLGRALHFLQDACVPHHSALVAGNLTHPYPWNSHNAYEGWVHSEFVDKNAYQVYSGGIYRSPGVSVHSWVQAAALNSVNYISYCNSKSSNFHIAAHNTVPYSQKVSAGFIKFFFDNNPRRH